jgi:hypothetical protein
LAGAIWWSTKLGLKRSVEVAVAEAGLAVVVAGAAAVAGVVVAIAVETGAEIAATAVIAGS